MAVTTNIYPPVIDTYMPAFLIGDVETTSVTKNYTVISYTDLQAWQNAHDTYIINSDVDGVAELWAEYEAELEAIRAQYEKPYPPEEIEKERVLKVEYDEKLVELISGNANQDQIENAFFTDMPDTTEISKTATFDTANTTDKKYICRVYFSLSPFNKLSQITNAQITVRSQLTNLTVLHKTKYPCEIMLQNIKTDNTVTSDAKYYIEIRPEDLEGCNFEIDQYYKVQIRFTSAAAADCGVDLTDKDAVQAIDSWLTNNLNYFTEWSTVCLIRGISKPTLTLQDFSEGTPTEIYDTIINTQVIGVLSFADDNETETLKSYRVIAYDNNDNALIDSGTLYANDFTDTNNFKYAIKYYFETGNTYYFTVTYTTQNLYSETHTYPFTVISAETPDLNLQVTAYKDEDNGRIGLRITRSRVKGAYTGQLIIRRASNKDNFTVWEDMNVSAYDHAAFIDYTWYDYTIESGVWYLYGIQGVDTNGARTPMSIFKEPVMVIFDNIYLVSGGRQLKIQFNPNISSVKTTLSEAKVDTIGSKYPFIKRNGYVEYVQFPISGLISSQMDEDNIFYSKEEAYGDAEVYYGQYNLDNNIPEWQDFVWEKAFRDEVSKFLYEDNVKLFRSPSEGNYLIRLMDVSFTPNQTLGRRLWTFNATAYEIDECSISNFKDYGVLTEDETITTISSSDTSDLMPIRRVVFIDQESDFPITGAKNVLYIFDDNLYIWDIDTESYKVISVSYWNDDDIQEYIVSGAENNELFADTDTLYIYNADTQSVEPISEVIMEG